MEKHCANHPESMALATCKACEKSICLMCVIDEKEGTFCSDKCVQVFREVADWVDTGAAATGSAGAPAAAAAQAPPAAPAAVETPPPQPASTGSIFDDAPPPAAAPPEATEQAQFEPLVAPGTKWRMIGTMCVNHGDTPAIATCDRCAKNICAMCVLEAASGTFCAECGAAATQAPPSAPAPVPAGRPSTGQVRPGAVARRASAPPEERSGTRVVAVVVVLVLVAGAGFFAYTQLAPPENPKPIPIATTNPKPPLVTNPPTKVDPSKVTPPKTDPPKTNPPKTDPPKTDPPKTDPPTTDPPKVDPPKTDPPKAPVKPEPPGRIINPWRNEEPGAWYRLMTKTGEESSYFDLGLKEKTLDAFVLSVQGHANGRSQPDSDVRTEVAPYWVKGEETLTISDRTFLCEVRESKSPEGRVRTWALIEGRHLGAVLKREGAAEKLATRRAWEHSLRVRGRVFDCLVLEAELEKGGARTVVKTWHSGELPMGTLRSETPLSSTTLVDLGEDWSKRPPFPK